MINKLKEVLPYPDEWYNTLSEKQIWVIYMKYFVWGVALPKTCINEQIEETPKILVKRRVYNGYKQVLADNGNWEEEYD